MDTYKNTFHSYRYDGSKEYYDGMNPVKYRGWRIYHRIKSNADGGNVYDIVFDGVCLGMYAGIKGAKSAIDGIISGEHHTFQYPDKNTHLFQTAIERSRMMANIE